MKTDHYDDVHRLKYQFIESGVLLAQQGEIESVIAHAMVEAGVEALTRIGGKERMAAALRQMADAVENSTN